MGYKFQLILLTAAVCIFRSCTPAMKILPNFLSLCALLFPSLRCIRGNEIFVSPYASGVRYLLFCENDMLTCFCVFMFFPNYHVVLRSGDRIPAVARFSPPVQTGRGAHPASCTVGTGSFPGPKRPGRGIDHPPSSAEVKESVELYLYSPSGPSWPVLGLTYLYLYHVVVWSN